MSSQVRTNRVCNALPPIVRLWILRMLVRLGGHRQFIREHGFRDDDLANTIGLGHWVEMSRDRFDRKLALKALQARLEKVESSAKSARTLAILRRSIAPLARLVGLSELDQQILEFVILIKSNKPLDDVGDLFDRVTMPQVVQILAGALEQDAADVRRALGPSGKLFRSGLLGLERAGGSYLCGKFSLISDYFIDHVWAGVTNPTLLLRNIFSEATPPHLRLEDFGHVEKALRLALTYLSKASGARKSGVNILLHGSPGTGKSQLSRLIAQELRLPLFEIASQDEAGDAIEGRMRLRAYRAAQSLFATRPALLLFDEVEDIFSDGEGLLGRKSTGQTRKAWVNRMLEENSVPTFWLTNDVRSLDAAFLRRFDLVLELPIPPRGQRERILRQSCGELLPEARLKRLAALEQLSPAVAARAADVVRTVQAKIPVNEVPDTLLMLIDNTLEAQGHQPSRDLDAALLPQVYDPGLLNASVDLSRVADGLKISRRGRLCMYGPPGTGKTAFGLWLAEQLDVPLHAKRASDLLSMWVGGSEKNIAEAFKRASEDRALLLIDEVDSFLQDRRGASRSWEVTAVNEMLTQMERFEGVFIASTNLMEGLDQAALRRFDLKICFGPLRQQQRWELLHRHCAQLGLREPDRLLRARLDRLDRLTPGDFAAVARRHGFCPLPDPAALVRGLEEECTVKTEAHKGVIGF